VWQLPPADSPVIFTARYRSNRFRQGILIPETFSLLTKRKKTTTKMAESPCRILVMASGNGSNFQALVNAVAAGRVPNSKIVRLIVNRAKAYATTRADQAGTIIPP